MIQFSVSTLLFCFILPIESNLSVATTPGQSGPGSNAAKKRYSAFLKAQTLL